MKVTRVAAFALAFGLLEVATPTLIVTTTAASLATLANGAAAVGAVLLGAALVGSIVRRGKRQASECLPFSDPNMLFNLAVNADDLDCSRRFVCEVSARDINTLTDEEKLIRSVFTSNSTTSEEESGRALLIKAATLGVENDIVICAATYSKCPFDSKTLLKEYQNSLQK